MASKPAAASSIVANAKLVSASSAPSAIAGAPLSMRGISSPTSLAASMPREVHGIRLLNTDAILLLFQEMDFLTWLYILWKETTNKGDGAQTSQTPLPDT